MRVKSLKAFEAQVALKKFKCKSCKINSTPESHLPYIDLNILTTSINKTIFLLANLLLLFISLQHQIYMRANVECCEETKLPRKLSTHMHHECYGI